MRRMRFLPVVAALAIAMPGAIPAPLLAAPAAKSAETSARARLEAAFAQLARQTDGTVGVAVQRVGGGDAALLNAGTTFPMASTFKIAVAGAILARIDKGEMTLGQLVTVDPALIVNSAGIAEQTPHDGVALSVHNLLELMLTRSDNTATDVLLAEAGGPAAVTAWLRGIGITGQQIDGGTGPLILRALGVPPGPGSFRERRAAAMADPTMRERSQKRAPNVAFNNDPRDASTPEAMLKLLLTIRAGKAVSAASTKTLIEIMERCHTGDKRLKGLLPVDTVVAHKTGTLMSIANDVGLVTLPDGSQFAIAVFVKGDTKGTEVQDRVIADVARTAYDYFLLGG
ncbi:class A beta-lactamase [Sphingomonas colocasiae]|uniref:Beta-lactamase n=1 Tax=Sphingomonas colocasiae TaxID=1848973 RepID=A0ABS7PQ42_9SPHN|nr:class A beta-lactamase [Sphingomonas colocasiae]MBY8822149.1 class A beta-lactamase [Sphingomonas colocasiae]